jgi:hypothetical protein
MLRDKQAWEAKGHRCARGTSSFVSDSVSACLTAIVLLSLADTGLLFSERSCKRLRRSGPVNEEQERRGLGRQMEEDVGDAMHSLRTGIS